MSQKSFPDKLDSKISGKSINEIFFPCHFQIAKLKGSIRKVFANFSKYFRVEFVTFYQHSLFFGGGDILVIFLSELLAVHERRDVFIAFSKSISSK